MRIEQFMSLPQTPRPREGGKYRIKHLSLGTFAGVCTYNGAGWSAFKVLDGNSELAGIDISPGETVELTTEFYRVVELEPPWNRQPE